MLRYGKISTCVYADEKFLELSRPQPNGQTLWFYLMTGPHRTSIPGLFCAGELSLSERLSWPIRAFRRCFSEIFVRGMIKADWSRLVVFMPKAIAHNEPENANVVRGWGKVAAEIPDCPLKQEALLTLKAYLVQMDKRNTKKEKPEKKRERLADVFDETFPELSGKPFPQPLPEPLPQRLGESVTVAGTVAGTVLAASKQDTTDTCGPVPTSETPIGKPDDECAQEICQAFFQAGLNCTIPEAEGLVNPVVDAFGRNGIEEGMAGVIRRVLADKRKKPINSPVSWLWGVMKKGKDKGAALRQYAATVIVRDTDDDLNLPPKASKAYFQSVGVLRHD